MASPVGRELVHLLARAEGIANQDPFILALGLFLAFLIVGGVARPGKSAPLRAAGGGAMTVAAVLALAAFATLVIWYVCADEYSDHVEPTMAAVAWLFHLGRPLYHALDAPERYAHIYGPWAFIIPAWTLAALGPSLAASKAAGGFACLATLLMFSRVVVRSGSSLRVAVPLTALLSLLCLDFGRASFWDRPDSLLLCFSTLALFSAMARTRWLAIVGVGFSAGVMLNLKITAVVAALPAFALLAARLGAGPTVAAAIVAIAATPVPFVVFPNVSFANYIRWLQETAGNGLLWSLFKENAGWAAFVLTPLAGWLLTSMPSGQARAERRWLVAAIVLASLVTVVTASTPGGGPWHLVPLLPSIVYAIACDNRVRTHTIWPGLTIGAARRAFVATVVIVAVLRAWYVVSDTSATRGLDIAGDLRGILDAHPSTGIEMGVSSAHEAYTFARPLLVFRTGAYLLDVPAVQEDQLSGLPLPPSTLEAIRTCRVPIWLFPKGGVPFDVRSRYAVIGNPPLFSDEFRHTFAASYVHAEDSQYFELWRCRTAVPGARDVR